MSHRNFASGLASGRSPAAALFEHWFFPGGEPDQREVTHALPTMLYKAFGPAPS